VLKFHLIGDIQSAVVFLTRLPAGAPDRPLARACWAFPIAGLLVGGVGGGVFAAGVALALPALVAALLAVAAMAAASGALHEDGLADTVDGLGGGDTPQRKLAIMRDSASGVYGVLALIFSVALRAAAIAAIADPVAVMAALLAASALSRGLLAGMMRVVPLASAGGLAASVGRPSSGVAWSGAGLGGAIAIALFGPVAGIGALAIGVAGVAAVAGLARRQIGGYNGDTLGAAQQIAEIAVLIMISAQSVP
jgi:adenosylcobinamide-GDP ribazoletransferase